MKVLKTLFKIWLWFLVIISLFLFGLSVFAEDPTIMTTIPLVWIGGVFGLLVLIAFVAALTFVVGAVMWIIIKVFFILFVAALSVALVVLLFLPFA